MNPAMNLLIQRRTLRARNTGVTLIELMIALLLGLLVSAAALNVFISNRETFRATENLSGIQENSRVAFELMSRDIREAGGTPCGNNLPVVSVVNNAATLLAAWGNPLFGYENGGLAGSIAGTDAIEARSGVGTGVTVTNHNPNSAQFQVDQPHGLVDGDIAMVCDFRQATIFQISNASASNVTLVHNTGGGVVSPGNASKEFPVAPPAPAGSGTAYCYNPTATPGPNCPVASAGPATIVRLRAVQWQIRDNGRGGRSLFRTLPVITSGNAVLTAQEIADNVQDMQIEYLQDVTAVGGYNAATDITDWAAVNAVRITLTLVSAETVGTNNAPLTRTFQHTIALRNRN